MLMQMILFGLLVGSIAGAPSNRSSVTTTSYVRDYGSPPAHSTFLRSSLRWSELPTGTVYGITHTKQVQEVWKVCTPQFSSMTTIL